LRGGYGRLAEDFGLAAAQEIVEKVVTQAETVQNRLGEAEVIVFKGDKGSVFDDKAVRGEQGAEGRHGEMVEMSRNIEVKPFVAREAGFDAAEVRDGAEKNSPGTQQARDVSDGGLRLDHVFEDVPHDDGIEAAVMKVEGANVADGHRKLQHVLRVGGGLRAELGAMHLPFTLAEFPEQKSRPATDVEDTALAPKHCFDRHGAPAVKRSLEAFDRRREASSAAAVVLGRIIPGQLSDRRLRARKSNRAITALFDRESVAGNVIARGEETLL